MLRITLALLLIIASTIIIGQQITIHNTSQEVQDTQYEINALREITEELYTETIKAQTHIDNLTQELNYKKIENEHLREQIPDNITIETPRKRVPIENITLEESHTTINIPDIIYGIIAPTGSMHPVLREDTLVLEQVPETPDEIHVGDIIIYQLDERRIIHRVVAIGEDEQGWFARTKGDNNPYIDPLLVRFEQVRGIVIGIIY